MVNTTIIPTNPHLRPPQIISLPLPTSTTTSPAPSNASSPDLTAHDGPSFSRPTMPSRHSMDSSTSTSTLSSISSSDSSSTPRSTPRTISTRSSFDPLSLPAEPPLDFTITSASAKAKLNRPRAHSHGHSNSYSGSSYESSVPRSEPGGGYLHPKYATAKESKRASYSANYSALTDGFASLGLQGRQEAPVLRPRQERGLSEEVRMEMRMFRD
ncbi:hypothetical protein C1H76_4523 [Elsinoe australis]|uniref:Uncharacterized protein n=1 Tax=Elsinoe australis TaxID=40998 RepID=A0A4U7B5Q9_9PEZI|nr:hypothetical protein C1H76_4523 [Elsinoe australis]